jgi:CBS domain-containing protein
MRVRDIMSKPVITCAPHDTLADAAGLMWDNECGALPVVEHGRLVGIITDRDVCMAAYNEGRLLVDIPVQRAMAAELVAKCKPGDTVTHAERLMSAHQVRRLPVVDEDGAAVGLLSLDDLARVARGERGHRKHEVRSAEIVDTLAAVAERRFDE